MKPGRSPNRVRCAPAMVQDGSVVVNTNWWGGGVGRAHSAQPARVWSRAGCVLCDFEEVRAGDQ